ncbi:NADH-quinone oxidoreductase subunit NuoF [Sporomusa acidovorans]|uniref:NADP-reducing hydrogenase subunit HndC n=1 Tax=Sporomusa acidovorans (strain ATCC 49682 / DSM 3132 / Mol) TaxID=1123286 RepID=A0ABZ3IVU3_SPOA4|nr:NADH-quinone oxidoreductase subunit NuoF [Sporomusa acidovorans]OZC17986.1 NADP-reducing hydrogenase subunit HndC [Sporomusa acidovorans DSM 3132]SDF42135.1 NAD(P)-dependent iron-only hydrogenase diaphorase component flavoprotein [Sporomusa acidovorans]
MQYIRAHVLICTGTGCTAAGAKKVAAALQKELAQKGLDNEIKIVETGCHGLCEAGPLIIVYPEGTFYAGVQAEDVPELVDSHLYKGRIVQRLLYKEPGTHESIPSYSDLSFYKKQMRMVLANCGYINPEVIEEYVANGGYEALVKVLTGMSPAAVIAEIKKSGLRGRGGGGFPTGMKWGFTHKAAGAKKYVVCNADEGDPGAFMDRSVLEGDPHRVIEGMAICGYAIGADEGYVYVRAEYPLAIKRLKIAIKQASDIGFLGANIFGSNFNFHLKIKEGAGAFVCGEETALLASIEGKRGMPRPRPPFPAVSGLWGKPTNINNVETYANVPQIITKGAAWYAGIGTDKSKGTKVFALTGRINHTGLAEVPMGISMREIIFDIGGGIPGGKKFKAVQIGGPSGGCLPEQLLDLPIDYDSLIQAGAMMGSGGLVVMDETTCMVDLAKFFLAFTQAESCGKCTPCREGTKRMLEILTRITEGNGNDGDIALLEDMARNIKSTALCGLGQTAPNPVLSTLRYFRSEYEAHIYDKRCPAGACTALTNFTITELCKGCGL